MLTDASRDAIRDANGYARRVSKGQPAGYVYEAALSFDGWMALRARATDLDPADGLVGHMWGAPLTRFAAPPATGLPAPSSPDPEAARRMWAIVALVDHLRRAPRADALPSGEPVQYGYPPDGREWTVKTDDGDPRCIVGITLAANPAGWRYLPRSGDGCTCDVTPAPYVPGLRCPVCGGRLVLIHDRDAPDTRERADALMVRVLAETAGDGLLALSVVVSACKLATPAVLDARPVAIVPHPIMHGAPREHSVSVVDRSDAEALTVQPGIGAPAGDLPLFAGDAPLSTAPSLGLVRAAVGSHLTAGRGARVDKRLFHRAITGVDIGDRRPGVRKDIEWTQRDVTADLWGDSYRPGKHGPMLLAGLRALVDTTVRILTGRTLRDGTPSCEYWIPVTPRSYPDPRDPDAPIRLRLEYPPGAERGARFARTQLITAGRESDPAYDLILALAFLWDRAKAANGGIRIYATQPDVRRDGRGHLLDGDGRAIKAAKHAPIEREGRRIWPDGNAPVSDWRHPATVCAQCGRQRSLPGCRPGKGHAVGRHPQAGKVPTLTREARREMLCGPRPAIQDTALKQRNRTDMAIVRAAIKGRVVIDVDGESLTPAWLALATPGSDRWRWLVRGSWRLLEPATG